MRTILLAVMMLAIAGAVGAQQPAPDPIGDNLFPPELVMQHQQEIGLTEQQRNYMVAEIGAAQQKAVDIQWNMQRETEKLAAIVKQDPIDEKTMLAQLDAILALERDMKRVHLTLVERIKNRLTPQQRARLQAFKTSAPK